MARIDQAASMVRETKMEKFGGILKNLRVEKKLSQGELANSTGITQSSLARYELDKTEPRLSDIKKLALFFGVSADYLLGLEDEAGKKYY